MKQPKILTLEQTMDRVNNDIKRVHLWQIFMGILLALILISEIIFRNETSYMPITLCLLLMLNIMSQSNSNSKAISKIYEKIMQDDKIK